MATKSKKIPERCSWPIAWEVGAYAMLEFNQAATHGVVRPGELCIVEACQGGVLTVYFLARGVRMAINQSKLVRIPMLKDPEGSLFPAYLAIGYGLSTSRQMVYVHAGSRHYAMGHTIRGSVLAVAEHTTDSRKDTILVRFWGWNEDVELQRWELEPLLEDNVDYF